MIDRIASVAARIRDGIESPLFAGIVALIALGTAAAALVTALSVDDPQPIPAPVAAESSSLSAPESSGGSEEPEDPAGRRAERKAGVADRPSRRADEKRASSNEPAADDEQEPTEVADRPAGETDATGAVAQPSPPPGRGSKDGDDDGRSAAEIAEAAE